MVSRWWMISARDARGMMGHDWAVFREWCERTHKVATALAFRRVMPQSRMVRGASGGNTLTCDVAERFPREVSWSDDWRMQDAISLERDTC